LWLVQDQDRAICAYHINRTAGASMMPAAKDRISMICATP
jgi:hypothetical protein